ncbi:hypothetical protein E3N88_11736 [Mikania micrantha]|uniref:Integrase catalytic domain-containing protein n=1 Tax=Mikania micrantha TaxID=192012 RepID=A0A5N6P4W4_9ASTR|nr:hypothetical protein E3N88_11736 [Mikania micrantha]
MITSPQVHHEETCTFCSLVDDFSRYMWVHINKSKDQAYEAFVKFKEAAEREIGLNLKALRTDRGGEFVPIKFEQLCYEDGINSNEIATMAMGIRCTTCRHAVYLLNRTPTKAKTPYATLKGRKPKIEHLRVFGCTVHVKVPSVKLKSWMTVVNLWCILDVNQEPTGPVHETSSSLEPDSPPLTSPDEETSSLSTPASSNSQSGYTGSSHFSPNDYEMGPYSPESDWKSPITEQNSLEQNSPTSSGLTSIPRSNYDDSPVKVFVLTVKFIQKQ